MSLDAFYVRQLHLLNAGEVDAWAATFTGEAVFTQVAPGGRTFAGGAPAQRRGREAIAGALRAAVAKRAGIRVVRRYWLGMLTAEPAPDGALRTRFAAFNVETPAGGRPVIHNSTTGEDLLVPAPGGWLVATRRITHDAVG
ncbi:nuclear transport factor 2 family protein [Dactylosporangium sp. NPDC049525]|uniref:nuclear transport factor 2 family protein n=1 Tax=Dactylosporangium sp. NPDC049525 TaxID=3154730 RepID=UPI00341671C7